MNALVRVIAPHFVAGFEIDGMVRRAAPIIKYMTGWTNAKARKYIHDKGWYAHVVDYLGDDIDRAGDDDNL